MGHQDNQEGVVSIMNHSRRATVLIVSLALLAAAIVSPAIAGTTVPIRGTVTGTVDATLIEGTENDYRLESLGSGTCSHMGRIEAIWVVPDVELNLEDLTLTVADLEWGGTLRAANGDEITGRYRFPSNTLSFSLTGEIVFDADLEVTGGTGRFEGATGHAHSTGTANIFTGSFDIEMVGEIATVGSAGR